ncbi:50S ribosomal protein L24 [Verrucomicrobia bacterium]|nr:50S ribosomal protein L24 [Verrucomicrobiota bacterium]
MRRFHVKKNDEVVVIAGADLGKRGRIIAVNPKSQRVIVEGVRMTKKHMRKNANNPQGAIISREGSVHISNVMKVEEFERRASRRNAQPQAQAPAPAPEQTTA